MSEWTEAGFEPRVTVKVAARFLGVSTSVVYAWVERKQIPHYRLGRAIRFKLSELDTWLTQFRVCRMSLHLGPSRPP